MSRFAAVSTALALGLSPAVLLAQTLESDPVTGVSFGGERVVILVDTSVSMLDANEYAAAERLSAPAEERREAPKWQQAIAIVEYLAGRAPREARLQVIAYAGGAELLLRDDGGGWAKPGGSATDAVDALRASQVPATSASNLHAALTAAAALEPPPDNVYLVTDGLPNAGPSQTAADADAVARVRLFHEAAEAAPAGAAINVVLLPTSADEISAAELWTLALRTGGALVSAPAGDGPGDAGFVDALFGVAAVDYVVFVVDTSGSMLAFAQNQLQAQLEATLAGLSRVKGLQIVNDEGTYMFRSRRGQWMSDTPATRQAIVAGAKKWDDFSNSNPREGIVAALELLEKSSLLGNAAIYVYGDDVSLGQSGAIQQIAAARIAVLHNRGLQTSVHAFAFPVFYRAYDGSLYSAADYAATMHGLATRSGGRFVGLPLSATEPDGYFPPDQ